MPIELKIRPRRSALLLGHDNTLEVLVSAVAPPPPEDVRPKKTVNLALVIDRSGSMSGQPLAEAKRCAAAIVDQLTPNDFVSVVAYDDRTQIICPAQSVTAAGAVKEAISTIREGGNTALHDGWAAGAEQAASNLPRADVSRVLLLSDGCANKGLTDSAEIAAHCAQMAEMGIGTSTYGLGRHFNEDLMLAMARSGNGNGYYGQTAADLMEPFQREFDLLQALCAQKLRLSLTTRPGLGLDVANDLPREDGAWRLTDVAYGSEAWAVVRVRVPAHIVAIGEERQVDLLTASLTYEADGRVASASPVSLALRSLPQAAYAALAEDEFVARRVQEVRFARFQQEASAAARVGDWHHVETVLEMARREAEGNAWLSASMQSLEGYARQRDRERFAKEATFKSARAMSRLSAADEDSDFSLASEASRPSFLRRKGEEGRAEDR